jgi:tetratricopeptide (TPR) repeat protein
MKRFYDCQSKSEKALELFPNQPQFYYFAGMSAMHNLLFQEALNHFEAGQDYVVRDPAFKAQFELAKAEVYLEQKQIPNARKHLESADYLAPNEKMIMNNRAFLMAKHQFDLDKALELIQQVCNSIENDPLFLDTYAWVLFARKEYEQGLNIIKKAHNLAPQNTEINVHYGDILYKLGRIDEALSFWIAAKLLGDESLELSTKIQNKKIAD